jgi:hypothetical protein
MEKLLAQIHQINIQQFAFTILKKSRKSYGRFGGRKYVAQSMGFISCIDYCNLKNMKHISQKKNLSTCKNLRKEVLIDRIVPGHLEMQQGKESIVTVIYQSC